MIDANVLVAGLSPKTTRSQLVVNRSEAVLRAVVEHEWPLLCLHVPAFCVAEAQCVFDKHRYCHWHGSTKEQQFRLTKTEYAEAAESLDWLVGSRGVQRLDIQPDHLRIVPLVSAVNYKYQFRRKSTDRTTGKANKDRIRPPMGSADCMLVAMAIDLASKVGSDDVVILTADRRLADVVHQCRRLTHRKATKLGLLNIADQSGLTWSTSLYPRCLDLGRATDSELVQVMRGWPLPAREIRRKALEQLTQREAYLLYEEGRRTKEATGVGPDSLPYTHELDQLQLAFARATGVYMTKAEIARRLLQWRKNPDTRPSEP